jgi:hypothetical protein
MTTTTVGVLSRPDMWAGLTTRELRRRRRRAAAVATLMFLPVNTWVLCTVLEVTPRTIQRWRTGQRVPTRRNDRRLRALGAIGCLTAASGVRVAA